MYKVTVLRLRTLEDAHARDKSLELEKSCDFLQSGLIDRLHGQHFAKRRKELSEDLASLKRQHSPTKRPRNSAAASSWAPTENDDVKYRDEVLCIAAAQRV